MTRPSRRELLLGAAALPWTAGAGRARAAIVTDGAPQDSAATASTLTGASGSASVTAPAFDDRHAPLPLPYKVDALAGLSGKLIQSHWENNYGGAVKALNLVRARLRAALLDTELPPYLYAGLKREQLLRTGSVVLHEHYFANLGGDGRAAAATRTRIATSFGSFDTWETEFRRIALGLGGGSGWVLLAYNPQLRLFENYGMTDHATAPVGTVPVLVLDMYEHAYQMDYGAAAARYVDAFFANLDWNEVGQRIARV